MARQFDALPGVGQLVAVDPQHPQVLVDEIADIEIIAVRAERDALGQRADLDLPTLVTFLPSILSATTAPPA